MKPHKLTPAGTPSSADGRWRHNRPERPELPLELEQQALELENAARAADRRELYQTDELWRLSKLKDNRERRLRIKRQAEVQAFLEAWIDRRRRELAGELLLEAICGRAWRGNRRRIRARAAAGNFRRSTPPAIAYLTVNR